MARYTLFRTDKVYITDGTPDGTKAIAESAEGFSYDEDITQTDGRLTFFLGDGKLLGLDSKTGALIEPDDSLSGQYFAPDRNLWPNFSAYIGKNTWIFTSTDHVMSYSYGGDAKVINDDLRVDFENDGVTAFRGHGFFVGEYGLQSTLYVTDGTEEGTKAFAARDPDGSHFQAIRLDDAWRISGLMLYSGANSSNDWSLFATDGTSDGTVRLADNLGFRQSGLIRNGDRFVFSTEGATETGAPPGEALQVWTTDGTTGQTHLVATNAQLASLSGAAFGELFRPSQPFVVGTKVFIAAFTSSDAMAVFDVTGDTPSLAHEFTLPSSWEPIQSDLTTGGFAKGHEYAVFSNGWLLGTSRSDTLDTISTISAVNVLTGATTDITTLHGESFYLGDQSFHVGNKIVVPVYEDSVTPEGLLSIDGTTLEATFIARDGSNLRDFSVVGGHLYWADDAGIYVSDGTVDGTHALADVAGNNIPAVLGSVTLDADAFASMGSLGDDTIDLHTSHKSEHVNAGAGDDVIRTGSGDDFIDGGVGKDRMSGGKGDDVYYVDNSRDKVIESAKGGTDHVFASVSYKLPGNVEELSLTGSANINGVGNDERNDLSGNRGNNHLSGGDGNDQIEGGRGRDSLSGGDGSDRLEGDSGRDTLLGGAGNDRFVFLHLSDSAPGKNADLIEDFASGHERIDLREIDADDGTRGNQAFHFVGAAAFSGEAGELRFSNGHLQVDTDGDKHSDLEIRLDDVAHLTAHDLML